MNERLSIYSYEDYREWLSAEITTRVQNHSPPSVNSFATKVSMSQSLLSLILRGKRKLTFKRSEAIAEYLELSERERKYLRLMVQLERMVSPASQLATKQEMFRLASESSRGLGAEEGCELEEESSALVLAASDLTHIEKTVESISAFLGFPLEKVQAILVELEAKGLVRHEAGRYFFIKDESGEGSDLKIIASNPEQIERVKQRIKLFQDELKSLLQLGEKRVLVLWRGHLEKLDLSEHKMNSDRSS